MFGLPFLLSHEMAVIYRMDANSHERSLTDAVLAVMKEMTDGTWVMNDQTLLILLVLTEGCCFREQSD